MAKIYFVKNAIIKSFLYGNFCKCNYQVIYNRFLFLEMYRLKANFEGIFVVFNYSGVNEFRIIKIFCRFNVSNDRKNRTKQARRPILTSTIAKGKEMALLNEISHVFPNMSTRMWCWWCLFPLVHLMPSYWDEHDDLREEKQGCVPYIC